MKLKELKKLTKKDLERFGFNGYQTDKIYRVKKRTQGNSLSIIIDKEKLKETYIKEWNQTKDSLTYFNEVIKQGFSIGAYQNNQLVGFALIGYYGWNQSMWIENIRVAESYHGNGIGKKLIEKAIERSSLKGARILGLETQSTNYPAIEFYKKCGFEISGVDFARYPQRENDRKQVAILMQFEIRK